MATNKNQHFVPRCYLRAFTLDSANSAINLFNIDRMKFVERAPVKHQCSGDYFYGESLALENALQATEGSHATAVREILTPGFTLTDTHRDVLRRFWLLTHANRGCITACCRNGRGNACSCRCRGTRIQSRYS